MVTTRLRDAMFRYPLAAALDPQTQMYRRIANPHPRRVLSENAPMSLQFFAWVGSTAGRRYLLLLQPLAVAGLRVYLPCTVPPVNPPGALYQ